MLCRCNCTDDRRRGVGLISPTQSERPVAAGKTSSRTVQTTVVAGRKERERCWSLGRSGSNRATRLGSRAAESRQPIPAHGRPRLTMKLICDLDLRDRFSLTRNPHHRRPPKPPDSGPATLQRPSPHARLPRFCALWDLPATPRPLSSSRATPRLPSSTPLPQPLRLDFPRLRRASLRCFG